MAKRPVVGLICVPTDASGDLAAYLERRGYDVREAREAWEAGPLAAAVDVDVAVVGPGLGPGAGAELLRKYGAGRAQFIVVARPGDLVERVLALELGAADAIESPINPRELAARIAGLIARRSDRGLELLLLEKSTVDLKAALVMHRTGTEEQLSPGQVALLRLFAENPHKVLTRDDIMLAAPAESTDAFDRSIDSRIVRLRRKLDTDSIATIRGTGYRFDPPGIGARPAGETLPE